MLLWCLLLSVGSRSFESTARTPPPCIHICFPSRVRDLLSHTRPPSYAPPLCIHSDHIHSLSSLSSVGLFLHPIHHPRLSHICLCRGFTQTEMLLPKLVIVATVLDLLSAATGEGGPAVSMEYCPSNGSTEGMLIAGGELWARSSFKSSE